MNQHYKLFAILFSLFLTSYVAIIIACSGEEPVYYSNFSPDALEMDDSFKLMFISENIFDYQDSDSYYKNLFNEEILQDWKNYLGDRIRDKDIEYLLTDEYSKDEIERLYNGLINPDSAVVLDSRFTKVDQKVKDFVTFLHVAKQVEPTMSPSVENWDIEYVPTKTQTSPAVILDVEQRYAQEQEPFLKNRYWFQVAKAKFYSADTSSVIEFFEKTKDLVPKNNLYYRAMSYTAGAHYRKKNFTLSNYLYSIVYSSCRQMRYVASYNFHPEEQVDFERSLQMAKTDEEKCSLWTLYGYYADQLQGIREIYKIDPANENIEVLITYFINSEERELNSGTYTSVQEYKKLLREYVDKAALALTDSIAVLENTKRPYFWYMGAGYFHMLSGNYTKAEEYLTKSMSMMPAKEYVKGQARLLKLVNNLLKIDSIIPADEKQLLSELDWLYNVCSKDTAQALRIDFPTSWSKLYLSDLYKANENTLYTELLNPTKSFYYEQSNIDNMIAFLSKNDKSDWEKMLTGQYKFTLSDVYEYQSIRTTFIHHDNLDIALQYLKISDQQTDSLYCNPFIGEIKDVYYCSSEKNQEPFTTRLVLLQKMRDLQVLINNGNASFENYVELGNAFYNINFYGNTREYYHNPIINNYGRYIDPAFKSWLMNSSLAQSYYTKALQLAINNEQRARCTYLLSKCERNLYYTDRYYSDGYFAEVNYQDTLFYSWNSFATLRNEYSNTKYFNNVINECGYFKSYVSKR